MIVLLCCQAHSCCCFARQAHKVVELPTNRNAQPNAAILRTTRLVIKAAPGQSELTQSGQRWFRETVKLTNDKCILGQRVWRPSGSFFALFFLYVYRMPHTACDMPCLDTVYRIPPMTYRIWIPYTVYRLWHIVFGYRIPYTDYDIPYTLYRTFLTFPLPLPATEPSSSWNTLLLLCGSNIFVCLRFRCPSRSCHNSIPYHNIIPQQQRQTPCMILVRVLLSITP